MTKRWEARVRMPTLRELRAQTAWMWLDGRTRRHRRPVLLVHLMLAFGIDASSDRVRTQARCKRCGGQGVDTYHPSWVEANEGSRDRR